MDATPRTADSCVVRSFAVTRVASADASIAMGRTSRRFPQPAASVNAIRAPKSTDRTMSVEMGRGCFRGITPSACETVYRAPAVTSLHNLAQLRRKFQGGTGG